ncbi:hypothetical protein [Bradyrhizobium sp.]|uniref:hypothetical protein n=1 Tax=Bradyrhizobium sp. TaxID=376 RepID=UPI003C4052F9
MRVRAVILNLAMFSGIIGAPLSSALADENRGTMEQQMACTPDVWRLCGDRIPDVDRIVACLKQNVPQLSDGCRAVFQTDDSDSAAAQNSSRQRTQRSRVARPRPDYDNDDQ